MAHGSKAGALLAVALAWAAALLPLPAAAETRALLVGVWQFHSPLIPDLKGPENDLAAMESLIRGTGAKDVTVLRNDAVTRTSFETALHALGLRSKPGDWIFIYYSGHGAEAEAAVKGTADGDDDQFLPLAGFDPEHQDPERFIVDKDLYAWVAGYVPRNVQVFMIADACHSGTLHRSIDSRAWRFTPRLAFRGDAAEFTLVARPAPRYPAILAGQDVSRAVGIQRADLPNEIYISAALDDQLALEADMPVEGAPSRGLLTYSFEQALTAYGPDGKTLAADADGDGKLTVGELAVYLNSQVRALTGQRQESAAHFGSGVDKLPLFEEIKTPPAPLPSARPLPGVFVSGGPVVADIPGGRFVTAAADADFVWDVARKAVVRRSGDIVAQNVTSAAALAGVIEKWGAIEALRPLLAEGSARVTIGPQEAGSRYATGSHVAVGLQLARSNDPRYLTVFNVASDGTVQRLYPLDADGEGQLPAGRDVPLLQNAVVPPYGTDHVVALVTPTRPDAFRALVRTADGQRAIGRLVGPLRDELRAAHGDGALSIGELYSGD